MSTQATTGGALIVEEWGQTENEDVVYWSRGHQDKDRFFAAADALFQQTSTGTLTEDLLSETENIAEVVSFEWWRFAVPGDDEAEARTVPASTPGAEPVTVVYWP